MAKLLLPIIKLLDQPRALSKQLQTSQQACIAPALTVIGLLRETSPQDKTTPWRAKGDDYWKVDDGKKRERLRSGQTPGAHQIEQAANMQERENGCRRQEDLILIIGCWMEKWPGPARFCITLLLPHLIWVTATVNVHSALQKTNEGKLPPRSAATSTWATRVLPL